MRKAFTLMELLIVIGIIAVLLSILLPVVSKMKASAFAASTAQSISALQAGIQQYWSTFNAYPGPTANGAFGAPFTAVNAPLDNVSSSEELVLALQGGIKADFGAASLTFVPTDVGRGTVSLNPRNPKRYQPFGGVKYADFNNNTLPEFQDAYPEPMPILYQRGRGGVAKPYNLTPFNTYGFTGFVASQFKQNPSAPLEEYFGDPGSATGTEPNVVWSRQRNADTYVLIAAGKDRKFGTKDDLTNFGTPGE